MSNKLMIYPYIFKKFLRDIFDTIATDKEVNVRISLEFTNFLVSQV